MFLAKKNIIYARFENNLFHYRYCIYTYKNYIYFLCKYYLCTCGIEILIPNKDAEHFRTQLRVTFRQETQ